MTLQEITTLIASQLGRELEDPFRLMLAERVDYWRSTLLSRSLEKNPGQESLFRTALLVPVSPVPDDVYAIPGSSAGNRYCSAPVPARLRYGRGKWLYVGAIDGTTPFRLAEPGQLVFLQSGRYSGFNTFYETLPADGANTLFMLSRLVPVIRVDDVFDSGMAILRFRVAAARATALQTGLRPPSGDIWELEYPASEDMQQMIVQYILSVDYERKAAPDTTAVEVTPEPK